MKFVIWMSKVWSLMKMNVLIFSSLLATVTSVKSKTVACKTLTKDHPLVVKDEFSEDYLLNREMLKNSLPIYRGKLFLNTKGLIRKTEKERSRSAIECDLQKGLVICPGREQESFTGKRPKSFKQIVLLKLPYKVKEPGYYEMSSKRGIKDILMEKYIPREFYKYYPNHKNFPMFKDRITGKLRRQFDFYVFGESAFALTSRSSGGGVVTYTIENYCILDLDLDNFPVFPWDISVPASEQKR